jgi:hypothetical protein
MLLMRIVSSTRKGASNATKRKNYEGSEQPLFTMILESANRFSNAAQLDLYVVSSRVLSKT